MLSYKAYANSPEYLIFLEKKFERLFNFSHFIPVILKILQCMVDKMNNALHVTYILGYDTWDAW